MYKPIKNTARLSADMCGVNQQGIALLITTILLGTIIATSLGVAVLVAGETGATRLIDDSVFAIFAADAGAEKMLYACSGKISYPSPASFTNSDLGNGSSYSAAMLPTVPATCADTLLKSIGAYGSAKRSIQLTY